MLAFPVECGDTLNGTLSVVLGVAMVLAIGLWHQSCPIAVGARCAPVLGRRPRVREALARDLVVAERSHRRAFEGL